MTGFVIPEGSTQHPQLTGVEKEEQQKKKKREKRAKCSTNSRDKCIRNEHNR